MVAFIHRIADKASLLGNPLGLQGYTQATSLSPLAGQAHGFIMGVARQPAVRRRYDDVYLFLSLGVVQLV